MTATADNGEPPDDWSYSLVYLRSGPGGAKITQTARVRLEALCQTFLPKSEDDWAFKKVVRIETGADIDTVYGTFLKTNNIEFLRVITATYAYLEKHKPQFAESWVGFVQRVFNEEHLAFRITPKGGVRHLVDEAFEAQRVSTIEALAGSRHAAPRATSLTRPTMP